MDHLFELYTSHILSLMVRYLHWKHHLRLMDWLQEIQQIRPDVLGQGGISPLNVKRWRWHKAENTSQPILSPVPTSRLFMSSILSLSLMKASSSWGGAWGHCEHHLHYDWHALLNTWCELVSGESSQPAMSSSIKLGRCQHVHVSLISRITQHFCFARIVMGFLPCNLTGHVLLSTSWVQAMCWKIFGAEFANEFWTISLKGMFIESE